MQMKFWICRVSVRDCASLLSAIAYELSKLILSSTVDISRECLPQQNGLATNERSHLASANRQLFCFLFFVFLAVVYHKKVITFSGYLGFANKMNKIMIYRPT